MPKAVVQPKAKAKAEAAVKAGAKAKARGDRALRGRQGVQAVAAGQAGADSAAGAVAAPLAVAPFDFAQFHADNRNQNAVNAQIYNEVLQPAIDAIVQDHGVFFDWNSALPLPIQQDSADDVGGFMAPFDLPQYKLSMASSGVYSAAIPLSWLEQAYSATPGVRLSMKQIKTGIANHKKMKLSYRHFPTLVIGVHSGQDPTQGRLTCLSPEEDRLAFLAAFGELLGDGLTKSERLEYRRKLYCVPAKFEKVDTEDARMFRAIFERRLIQKRFMLTKRSAAQLVDEVMTFWARKEHTVGKMTPDKLFGFYHSALGDTDETGDDGDDASLNMSKTCIMNAQNVHKHILSDPTLNELVQKGDVLGDQSPFHGLASLKAVQTKCKTVSEKEWVMTMMLDAALTDPDQTQWSTRQLAPRNQKGLVDKWIFKKKVHTVLLNQQLNAMQVCTEEAEKIRQAFNSLTDYRNVLGWRRGVMTKAENGGHVHKASYWAGMSQNGEKFIGGAEMLLWQDKHDTELMNFIQTKEGTAEELFGEKTFTELFEVVNSDDVMDYGKAEDGDAATQYKAEYDDPIALSAM